MRNRLTWRTVAIVCLLISIASIGGYQPAKGNWPHPTVVAFGQPLAGGNQLLCGGRIFVPATSFQSALGLDMDWDPDHHTLYFNSARELTAASAGGSYHGYPLVKLQVNGQAIPAADYAAILLGGQPYVPLRLAQEFGLEVGWLPDSRTAFIGTPDARQLPRVGTAANLAKILAGNGAVFRGYPGNWAVTEQAIGSGAAPAEGKSADYSATNTQVQGVDEADIVKTDGRYIYQVRQNSVLITHAYPEDSLRFLCSIDLAGQGVSPVDLFIDGDRLLVVGQSGFGHYPDLHSGMLEDSFASNSRDLMPAYPPQKSSLLIYDLIDREQPQLMRTVELGGSYLTARKVDSRVIFLANQSLYGNPVAPCYRDSLQGENWQSLALTEVGYFPEREGQSYLLTAVCDLDSEQEPASIAAYLGAGDNVYMSASNLYVAASRWWGNETNIYKFHLLENRLAFQSKGALPGRLLNQFSMDEWADHLRVATTYDQGGRTENGVFIFDDAMEVTGRLTAIAPGERIYAARFMQERGYLVTFFQVDPLFVLDLSDNRQPTVLGALKIPGFSSYLHPIGDHHLLGIGRDTVLVEDKDRFGKVVSTRVLERGLKLALFDVTDLSHPQEQASVLLGGSGSQSEALSSHRAVLYSSARKLLALPVQLTDAAETDRGVGPTVFQGAVAYAVDVEQGFQEIGQISHLTAAEMQKLGYYGYAAGSRIQRLLYIRDFLYAISDEQITVHQLATMQQIAGIRLP